MPCHALTRMGAPAVIVLSAAMPALVQDSAITGARVTVIEKSADALSITLQNLRDSPLVVWELALVRRGASAPTVVTATDFTRPFPYRPDSGPLNPSEQRMVQFLATDFSSDSDVVVRLAVFADGYYEGQRASADVYRRRRKSQADDIRFWLGAVEKAPRNDDERLRSFLREQHAQHAAGTDARGPTREGPRVTGEIDQVIMRAESAPGEVLALAADGIARLKQERALLTGHHAR